MMDQYRKPVIKTLLEVGAYTAVDSASNMLLKKKSLKKSLQYGEIMDFAVGDAILNLSGKRAYITSMVEGAGVPGMAGANAANAVAIALAATATRLVRGKAFKLKVSLEIALQAWLALGLIDYGTA